MSQRVKNAIGTTDTQSIGTGTGQFGEGVRRVVFQGIEHIVNVNEQKGYMDDEVAKAVGAGTGLRVADSRDGDRHSRR